MIFAGLVGAILWNLLTWLLGLPSSSSHALIGGLIGATLVAAGADAVKFGGIVGKVLLPAVLSPIVAGLVALIATPRLPDHGARGGRHGQPGLPARPGRVLVHGRARARHQRRAEDDGVITLALITAGALPSNAGPPFWVIVSSGLAIGLGTYAGGWRIINTLGRRVSEIQTAQGFTSGTSTAAVILTSSHLGFPLSTTQVATGAVVGAGAGRGVGSVHWGLAGQVAVGWLLTLPSAALVGALAAWVAITGPAGTIIVAVVLIGIYAASRRCPVTPDNVNETPRRRLPRTSRHKRRPPDRTRLAGFGTNPGAYTLSGYDS